MALAEARSRLPERSVPTRLGAALFQLKANLFRARRFAAELGRAPARLKKGDPAGFAAVLAESRSPLWSDPRAGERALQWGKVQNLRVAARLLDRTVLPAGAVFSFWRQMGRASARRGFVAGRMLQEGCLVPATGGGLCQLSNALYDAALTAGCAIVERHAHSRIVPGSRGTTGRDATVAWNYVDLRFAAPRAAMLRVAVERDELVVRLVAQGVAAPPENRFTIFDLPAMPGGGTESCGICAETGCFRHEGGHAAPEGRTAFLVDENWPEFRRHVAQTRRDGDVLALPLDGARWRAARYAWDTGGFGRVAPASLTALMRSLRLRFAKDGAERRAADMRGAEALARRLAQALTPDVTEVVAAQSLLPFLWRERHLGGRRLSVLMTRMPMEQIEARLDAAAARHPGRRTLADFRADPALVASEREALAAADSIVTPHAAIAELFGERAVRLDWAMPKARARAGAVVPRRITFPGPTIARKGAYELREAAKALDLEIMLVGSALEGADFWDGVRSRQATSEDWLDGVAAVVQPALLEDAPRRLLQALASGVPVVATQACGLPPQNGLTLVPADDADALIAALRRAISGA
ncbi:MAG: VanW family protein [Rhizomicrobium sp.]